MLLTPFNEEDIPRTILRPIVNTRSDSTSIYARNLLFAHTLGICQKPKLLLRLCAPQVDDVKGSMMSRTRVSRGGGIVDHERRAALKGLGYKASFRSLKRWCRFGGRGFPDICLPNLGSANIFALIRCNMGCGFNPENNEVLCI